MKLLDKYELDEGNFEKDWDIQGICLLEKQGDKKVLKIMNSEVGCILKNRRWNNFEFSFEFKLPKLDELPNIHWQHEHDKDGNCGKKYNENEVLHRGFGVIVKARSLDEYQMLKIDINGYHPHTRAIVWENFGPIITKNEPDESWIDDWVKAKFLVNGNLVEATINKTQKFSYYLPTSSAIATSKREFSPAKFLRLNDRDGSIGFRCSPTEVVYIRDLKVINKEELMKTAHRSIALFIEDIYGLLDNKGEVGI